MKTLKCATLAKQVIGLIGFIVAGAAVALPVSAQVEPAAPGESSLEAPVNEEAVTEEEAPLSEMPASDDETTSTETVESSDESLVEEAGEAADEAVTDTVDTVEDAAEATDEAVEDAAEATDEAVEDAAEATDGTAEDLAEPIDEATTDSVDETDDAVESTEEPLSDDTPEEALETPEEPADEVQSQEETPNVAATNGTIVDVAAASGTFETLVAALTEAELAEMLEEEGPFTVFAPTDEAFAALPEETVEALLLPENRDLLVQVLSYHVVPGAVMSDQLTSGEVSTVEGNPVTVMVEEDMVMVNDANVIQADIPATNGVIHAIDRVMLPPELQ